MEHKKNIYIIFAAALFFIIFSGNIYNTAKYHQLRGLCSQYRESLIATENANRELADRIGRVAEITGRIKETADSNVTDARGIVEAVEVLRSQIKELEDCCGSFNQSEYYSYYDSYFQSEGLMD